MHMLDVNMIAVPFFEVTEFFHVHSHIKEAHLICTGPRILNSSCNFIGKRYILVA